MKSFTAEQSSGAHRKLGACRMTHPFSKPLLLFTEEETTLLSVNSSVSFWWSANHLFVVLPVASRALWCCVAVMIDRIQETRLNSIVWTFEIVECGVERQTGAHPEEHSGAQPIAWCPEIVFTVTGILQILAHRLNFFFRFKRCQLKAQRSTILVCQEVIQLGWVWVHSTDKVLNTVQLNRGYSLPWNEINRKYYFIFFHLKFFFFFLSFLVNNLTIIS